MATKVHLIYEMGPVIVFVPSLTFSTVYIVSLTMSELWKLGTGKALALKLFFLLSYSASPATTGKED